MSHRVDLYITLNLDCRVKVARPESIGHDKAMSKTMNRFRKACLQRMERLGLSVNNIQMDQLSAHYQAMIEINPKMNLTRITDPVEAAVKHYADSLSLLGWVEQNHIQVTTVLDVGTGAGFPSVPLAVMKPQWDITAIDAAGKKINFLKQVMDAVSIANLYVEHAHTNHWRTEQTFSIVLTKAVAPLIKCFPFAVKFTSKGGFFVAYKTTSLDPKEQADAELRLNTIPLQAIDTFAYDLEYAGDTLHRMLYVYRRLNV